MRRTSGLPLLILIFVSLCLITFSLLSVSESRADQTLGEKMAARTTTYYETNTPIILVSSPKILSSFSDHFLSLSNA